MPPPGECSGSTLRGSRRSRACCGRVNRGLAILGDTLFMGTIDGHLIAIDAKTGKPIWDVAVAKPESGYSFTLAPLIVKDKVIVGPSGGEYGIRGFIAAFDAATGKEAWRFNTIPGPGEPGHETWTDKDGNAWKTGGGPAWVTGTYDPALNLCIGAPETPARTGTAIRGPATISIRIRCSPSIPTRAS